MAEQTQERYEESTGTEKTSGNAPTSMGSNQTQLPMTARDFFTKYRKFILGGVVALVVVIIGFIVYGEMKKGENDEAIAAALPTFRLFEQDSIDLALKGSLDRPSLDDIAEQWSGTKTGNTASYMAGVAHLEKGDYARAIEYLEDFDKGDDMVSALAYNSLGTAYEAQQDYDQAVKNYQKAAETNANSHTSPFFLANAARVLELSGDKEAALQAYKRLRQQYPLSEEGQAAEKNIYRLGDTL